MADIKTHLREISVATTIGLLKENIKFKKEELYSSQFFWKYATELISNDISSASNIKTISNFTGEYENIINNGFNLGYAIFNNPYFNIDNNSIITWQGNNTQKDDPIDITVGQYGFSLKEESFILENMGLYKLLNCYTGSKYKKRHIFSDYARDDYEFWFQTTWNELILYLNKHNRIWEYIDLKKNKHSIICLFDNYVQLKYYEKNTLLENSTLQINCSLHEYETKTNAKIREKVFSKFINQELGNNKNYYLAKRQCAITSSKKVVEELNSNLKYSAGLPRFLRIHPKEYYYAKTTGAEISIYKVPSLDSFKNEIKIESIVNSVPDSQANILTTIKNIKTGKCLTLRNECRFSHGQFNGTPEAKMYYEHGGSLEVIYEKV